MVKFFLKTMSVFVVMFITIFSIVQFHPHDCLGKVCLPNHYAHNNDHNHEHDQSHTHECDDSCPIVDLEATNVNDVSVIVELDKQDSYLYFYHIANVQLDIASLSALNVTRADYVVPIKNVILSDINQYRGSPFFAVTSKML